MHVQFSMRCELIVRDLVALRCNVVFLIGHPR
jgi:hypothetical protein